MSPQIPQTAPPATFLSLPLELRQQIYTYILPTTQLRIPSPWHSASIPVCNLRLGNTSILRVNKLINAEASNTLFAHFLCCIYIGRFGRSFNYSEDDGIHVTAHSGSKIFGRKSLSRFRKFVVVVYWDDFLRGCPSQDLALMLQTEDLCDRLRRVDQIRSLHVHVLRTSKSAGPWRPSTPGSRLGPLSPWEKLRNVRRMKVSGVDEEIGKSLESTVECQSVKEEQPETSCRG